MRASGFLGLVGRDRRERLPGGRAGEVFHRSTPPVAYLGCARSAVNPWRARSRFPSPAPSRASRRCRRIGSGLEVLSGGPRRAAPVGVRSLDGSSAAHSGGCLRDTLGFGIWRWSDRLRFAYRLCSSALSTLASCECPLVDDPPAFPNFVSEASERFGDRVESHADVSRRRSRAASGCLDAPVLSRRERSCGELSHRGSNVFGTGHAKASASESQPDRPAAIGGKPPIPQGFSGIPVGREADRGSW